MAPALALNPWPIALLALVVSGLSLVLCLAGGAAAGRLEGKLLALASLGGAFLATCVLELFRRRVAVVLSGWGRESVDPVGSTPH